LSEGIYDTVKVFYASESGTSMKFALKACTQFRDLAGRAPLALDDLPKVLHDQRAKTTTGKLLVLIVTSTFGKGNPPSSGKMFEDNMKSMQLVEGGEAVPNCDFSVLGLGNSAYSHTFVAFARKVHALLLAVGCTAATALCPADELVNQTKSFEQWMKSILNPETGIFFKQSSEAALAYAYASEAAPQFMEMKFVNSTQLWGNESASFDCDFRAASMFFFQHEPGALPETFQPGDHIAIMPKNPKSFADKALRLMSHGESGLDHLQADVYDNFVQDFIEKYDLGRPLSDEALLSLFHSPDTAQTFAKGQPAHFCLKKLLDDDDPVSEEDNPTLNSLVRSMPSGCITITWAQKWCPRFEPRFYSIACTSKHKVGILQASFFYPGSKMGTASHFFRTVQAGEVVKAKFVPSRMHLPQDSIVIMIANGSGIAPFRSYWRKHIKSGGADNCKFLLFFGCQTPDDVPFRDEIDALVASGDMEFFPAYSRIRDQPKKYVDDVLRDESERILGIINDRNTPSHIHLCGLPASEQSIHAALVEMMAAGSSQQNIPGLGVIEATRALSFMEARGRYIPEVYGQCRVVSPVFAAMRDEFFREQAALLTDFESVRKTKARQVPAEDAMRMSMQW